MARLDALKGLERSSIAPRFRPPDFCAERQFASPIQTVEAIEVQLRKLADDLVVLLERQAKGARRIELSLYRVDGAMRRIRIGASRPLNEARAIVRLIAERLASPNEDAIDAGYGVDLMRLACLTPSRSRHLKPNSSARTRPSAPVRLPSFSTGSLRGSGPAQ
jgi:protein ImuB